MECLVQKKIKDCTGKEYSYEIIHDKNYKYNCMCNISWKTFELKILDDVVPDSCNDEQFYQYLSALQFHDIRWNWEKKYLYYSDENTYDWFFIIIDGKIQAVTLISHPKKSVINGDDIFYIEYIAVAPWNRTSSFYSRQFSGLGSILMKTVSKYYSTKYGYRDGFSLSAVPQAIPFYKKIGMTAFPVYDANGCFFYEFEEEKASKFLRGA